MVANFRIIAVLSLLLFSTRPSLQEPQCDADYFGEMSNRFDCYPRVEDSYQDSCADRGCCFDDSHHPKDGPWCFYPKNYETYQKIQAEQLAHDEFRLFYEKVRDSAYSNDVEHLRVDVVYETENRLRVKIYGAENQHRQAPSPKVAKENEPLAYKYDVELQDDHQDSSFGFAVVRMFPRRILFDTRKTGSLIMADNFIQISAKVASFDLYGMGETRKHLFNYCWTPDAKVYGSYHFYLGTEEDGKAHGVVLLNTNSKVYEIFTQPKPAITYRAHGGVFDFYFLVGDSPAEVVHEYIQLIGKPYGAAYWYPEFQSFNFPSDKWRRLFK